MLLRSERKRKIHECVFACDANEEYDYREELEKLSFYSLENPPPTQESDLSLLNEIFVYLFLISLILVILSEHDKIDLCLHRFK
jgi:hypothetical protein